MSVLACPACGAPIKSIIGTAYLECEYCGSRCTRESAIPTGGPTCESLTLRGEIHLSSGQWSEAAQCFRRAQEIAPMYAPAYYGSLLASLKCRDEEELSTMDPGFCHHADYCTALRFADEALRRKLEEALRKAEERKARRLEEERRKEEARLAREQKKKQMQLRHQEEHRALIRRNRRKMWRMWLFSLGTLFFHLFLYAVIEEAVKQLFGYRLGGAGEMILSYGTATILFSVLAMVFMTNAMLKKSYGRPEEKKFVWLCILFLFLSLLCYLYCIACAVFSIGQTPFLIVTLLILLLPCGITFPIIFTARKPIKPLKQLQEEQQQELNRLMSAEL